MKFRRLPLALAACVYLCSAISGETSAAVGQPTDPRSQDSSPATLMRLLREQQKKKKGGGGGGGGNGRKRGGGGGGGGSKSKNRQKRNSGSRDGGGGGGGGGIKIKPAVPKPSWSSEDLREFQSEQKVRNEQLAMDVARIFQEHKEKTQPTRPPVVPTSPPTTIRPVAEVQNPAVIVREREPVPSPSSTPVPETPAPTPSPAPIEEPIVVELVPVETVVRTDEEQKLVDTMKAKSEAGADDDSSSTSVTLVILFVGAAVVVAAAKGFAIGYEKTTDRGKEIDRLSKRRAQRQQAADQPSIFVVNDRLDESPKECARVKYENASVVQLTDICVGDFNTRTSTELWGRSRYTRYSCESSTFHGADDDVYT